MSSRPPAQRTAADELADATHAGDIWLRRLVRGQLTLSLLTLTAFGGLIGGLPLAVLLVPALEDVRVLGVPLSVGLLLVPPFAIFVGMGWLYERRARALDEAFRDLVRER